MELTLHRKKGGEKATLGDLYMDGKFCCHTLEDKVRIELGQPKVFGETAIPAGRYKVIVDFSQKFQKNMFHVLDVPQFTGIRIHCGNTDKNTEGCILVGSAFGGDDLITGSTIAYNKFAPVVQAVLDKGEEVFITITNDFLES